MPDCDYNYNDEEGDGTAMHFDEAMQCLIVITIMIMRKGMALRMPMVITRWIDHVEILRGARSHLLYNDKVFDNVFL